MEEEHVISLEKVRKSYSRKPVLRDISFSVSNGSLIGIEGENGSGKSTLLNIISGYLRADSGSVQLNGSIGFCPQDPMLFMQLSAEENIRLFSRAYGIDNNDGQERGKENSRKLLETFRYNEPLSKRCFSLSGGTIQKLNLVLALLHDPDILLLDEPYAAFDWQTYQAFWKYAGEMKENGKTVLIISHIVYERDRFDRILTLEKGQLQ